MKRSADSSATGWERGLRGALFCALGLLLLTPFVVTPGTVYPFVVGKALWSRSLIEIAFALWAVLALTRRGYRPPQSWLLLLLGVWIGVLLLSASCGVSPQRSLWSTYERMQGVLDQAHWAALAVVLTSLLRSPHEWRTLLAASVVSGAAMACLVIARALDLEVPFFGRLPESHSPRLGGPLGNPLILGVHLLANLMLAVGLAARALTPAIDAAPVQWRCWAAAAWAAAAAAHLAALVLAGSAGAFSGLGSAAGFAALAFAWIARGWRRLAAIAVIAVMVVAVMVLGQRFFDAERTEVVSWNPAAAEHSNAAGALSHVVGVHLQQPNVQSRLGAWEAAIEGFAERPLLGWGPENFLAVFGRFASGFAATGQPHDYAHGKLFEAAATTGAAGLVVWLALWGLALVVLLRAAFAMEPPDCRQTVFAAAALFGYLVQIQTLFDTAAGSLLSTVLLAFAVRLEEAALPHGWRPRLPHGLSVQIARSAALLACRKARGVFAATAVALAFSGIWVNQSILGAADAYRIAPHAPLVATLAGIRGFPPLANTYRQHLIAELARIWPELHARNPALAAALHKRVEHMAEEAVRTEPSNWVIARELARLYRATAATDPNYEERASRHFTRARALAPGRPVFAEPLAPPDALAAQRLADGRLELRWRTSPGAGYHQIAQLATPNAWRTILYAYDTGQSTLIVPAGPFRYRIRACRHSGDCSAWQEWSSQIRWNGRTLPTTPNDPDFVPAGRHRAAG